MTLATYTRELKQLGETVEIVRANGERFKGYVLSVMAIDGLQTVTVGYGGMASELYREDHQTREEK